MLVRILMVYISTTTARRLLFLGTPDVAALSLKILLNSPYEIVSVVTQPPAPVGRKQLITPSPVHVTAMENNIPVLHPESAKDPEFLSVIESMAPDLCITVIRTFTNVFYPRITFLNIGCVW